MSRIHVHELLLMGILTALLFIGQVFLAFLPNIEIVSFLIILYTLVFGRKVFLMIYTFMLLEGILYGFGLCISGASLRQRYCCCAVLTTFSSGV